MFRHRFVWLGVVTVTVLVVAGCTTWVSQSVPTGTGRLSGVSCPSTTNCVAVGSNAILTTDNGGSSWSSQPLPAGTAPARVSCPTTSHCVAVGGSTSLTTDDGGQTWVSETIPAGAVGVGDVSCPSATFCVAVGGTFSLGSRGGFTGSSSIATTTDGGATWVSQAAPTGVDIGGVSCPSTTLCVAVADGASGPQALTTTDGGVTWISHAFPSSLAAFAFPGPISCPSVSTCVAAGSDVTNTVTPALIATNDGGTTWVGQTVPSPPPGAIESISCASTTTCEAVGGGAVGTSSLGTVAIIGTTDGGSTWTNQTVPSGAAGLRDISCPSTVSCLAVGQDSQGNGAIIRTG